MKSPKEYKWRFKIEANQRLPTYGGQAVIEGVMMRGAKAFAIAVRRPDKMIEIETKPLNPIYQSVLAKIPFLRGLLFLGDALILGTRALTFSANLQVDEDEKIEGKELALTLAFSLTIAIVLFTLFPVGVGALVEQLLGWSPWLSNLFEGLVRLGLLVGYIWAVGFVPDIRRVYGYHGAEHKTINAFEAGADISVESVKRFPLQHPRCGTSFLLTVVSFSIILFSALGPLPFITRLVSRLLLIPVLASLAYEYIRLTSRLVRFRWVRALLTPNLWLQKLTTIEPDDDMLEVAIAAFKTMQTQEGIAPSEGALAIKSASN
jgi:uncharacterized protein YqhQ